MDPAERARLFPQLHLGRVSRDPFAVQEEEGVQMVSPHGFTVEGELERVDGVRVGLGPIPQLLGVEVDAAPWEEVRLVWVEERLAPGTPVSLSGAYVADERSGLVVARGDAQITITTARRRWRPFGRFTARRRREG